MAQKPSLKWARLKNNFNILCPPAHTLKVKFQVNLRHFFKFLMRKLGIIKIYRATVASADFSNYILARTKCTFFTPNCLVGFNPSITKDCPGHQLSRDRGIDKKHLQEHQKCSTENILILPPIWISVRVVTF